ncbi:MAG: PP2C family protein-serine/threonine phosphatase [Chitinophagales bacterium]
MRTFAGKGHCMVEFDEKTLLRDQIRVLETKIGRQVFQLKGLMSVTQAINENVGAEGLFEMLGRFLSFEMQVGSFALLFREGNQWKMVAQHEANAAHFDSDSLSPLIDLHGAGTRKLIKEREHPFIAPFEYGLKVMHKDIPLAYLLMANLRQPDDLVSQLDFVTAVTNVVAVAIENKRLFKEQIKQKLINREVELAAGIQQSLIPHRLPSGAFYEMGSVYRPHFAVGGDYYDVIEFPDGKITFCIADITGKGVAAALLMANFQANFNALVPRTSNLEEIVREMNAAVYRVTEGDRFITLFIAQYNPLTRTLEYVNAGHTPPVVISDQQVSRLRSGSTILGWLPELPFLEIGSIQVNPDTLLFSYTDGLTDVCNPKGEDFSDHLLAEFLLRHLSKPINEINSLLIQHIERFKGDAPYPDDITVLSCRIH